MLRNTWETFSSLWVIFKNLLNHWNSLEIFGINYYSEFFAIISLEFMKTPGDLWRSLEGVRLLNFGHHCIFELPKFIYM